MVSSTSWAGRSRGGSASVASAICSARRCIFGQSSTASRTSRSTRSRSSASARAAGLVADPVDLDAHPGLDDGAVADLRGGPRGMDLEQLAGDVAADHEQRVDHQVDRPAAPAELGGDRVDEERHVVAHDLDDRVLRPRRPSPSPSAVVTRTMTRALRPVGRQLAVGDARPPSAPAGSRSSRSSVATCR